AHESPSPCRVSASLTDPNASGGRGRTTSNRPAQSILTRSTPAGAARPAAAAADHPYAATAPHAARDGGDYREPRVALGPVHRGSTESLDPRRLVGDGTAAGQCPGHHQTARRPASGRDGAALYRSLSACAGPTAAAPAASTLGAGVGGVLPDRPGGWLDPGSAAQKDAGFAGRRGPSAWRQDDGDGAGLQPPSVVAALYRRCRRQ